MMFEPEATSRVAKRPAAREFQGNQGLCWDCVAAGTCTFPRDPSRPVWSCEEFEGGEFTPSRPAVPGGQTSHPPSMADTAEAKELKGLCRECARRLDCRYPKPPGGVWHCEELA